MKTKEEELLESLLKKHGILEYDVRLFAVLKEFHDQFKPTVIQEESKDIQEMAEELFDKYSWYVDDNLSAMEMVSGRDVILQNDFMSACKDLSEQLKHPSNNDNAIEVIKKRIDELKLQADTDPASYTNFYAIEELKNLLKLLTHE